jgi:hypothetical protein
MTSLPLIQTKVSGTDQLLQGVLGASFSEMNLGAGWNSDTEAALGSH